MPKYAQVIETKIIAAAAGSGAGAAVSAFVLYLIGAGLYHASWTTDSGADAIKAVPIPVSGIVALLLVIVGAAGAGYGAPHTERAVISPVPAVDLDQPVMDDDQPVAADQVLPELTGDDKTDAITGMPVDAN